MRVGTLTRRDVAETRQARSKDARQVLPQVNLTSESMFRECIVSSRTRPPDPTWFVVLRILKSPVRFMKSIIFLKN